MSRTFQSSFSRFSRNAALLGRVLLWLAATAGLAHAQQQVRPPAADELFFLWAIQSNARQHAFVKQTLAKYIGDHPATPATKALSAATGIKNTRT